jgi:hypothetical protein
VADQFTAVEVTVKFTVLTTSSVVDGSLVEFGNNLQDLVRGAAQVVSSETLHGVPGQISVTTETRVLDV